MLFGCRSTADFDDPAVAELEDGVENPLSLEETVLDEEEEKDDDDG